MLVIIIASAATPELYFVQGDCGVNFLPLIIFLDLIILTLFGQEYKL
jgi:hypothetical protein